MAHKVWHHHGQMSEAFRTVMFLSASGGLQDAYTYIGRGKVFANAQTGNIVLMSQAAFDGDLARVLHYLVPLLSFALGVAVAEAIHIRYREAKRLHWRQLVLVVEILLLFGVGFLPNTLDLAAIPVLRKLTHLPIIIDPSHATGKSALVEPLAKGAVATGCDGLQIEVHNDPAHALCDGPQSLRPEAFDALAKKLLKLHEMMKTLED